mmetsp:Transcript_16457/g.49923  ORF Transcript_16457/g.49923 Transcript_16457/m.49923 type:complete len:793 (-) Transcript_16457:952-3330(-)
MNTKCVFEAFGERAEGERLSLASSRRAGGPVPAVACAGRSRPALHRRPPPSAKSTRSVYSSPLPLLLRSPASEFVLDEGHLHVLVVLVVAANLKRERVLRRLELRLRDLLHQLTHRHRHPLLELLLVGEEGVEDGDAARDHRHLELVPLLEVGEELLEGELSALVHLVPVPQRPLGALCADLALGRGDGLREGHEGEGEVDEAVLEGLDRLGRLHELEQLEADEPGDERGGGGDGGDDLARDLLGAVVVRLGDLVVARAQVGGGGDEVDVEVGVVVLLKVDRSHPVPRERRRRRQRRHDGVARLVLVGRRRGRRLLRLLRVRGDLDALLRDKLGHHRRLDRLLEESGVGRALEAVVEGTQVGGGDDETEVERVVRRELERRRRPLGARPEGGTGRGGHVEREVEDELRDLVVEELLEAETRPDHTLLERDRLVDEVRGEGLERRLAHAGLPLEVGEEVWLGEVGVDVLGALPEEALEAVAAPLDGVLDLVRKVLERADRDALLGRVARRAVALGELRDDDLHVPLRAERAALEERLLVVDAALVDVQPRLHVVERVAHAGEAAPEGVVEDALCLGAHPIQPRLHLGRRVHRPDRRRGAGRLCLGHVPRAEEELAVEIRLLDCVWVGDRDVPALAAADAHHRPVLEHLAPDRARPDEQVAQRAELLLRAPAERRRLRVVPRAARRRLCGRKRLLAVGRQALLRVEVEPLLQRHELAAGSLHHLLRSHAAKDGAHRRELAPRPRRQVAKQPLRRLRLRGAGRAERLDGARQLPRAREHLGCGVGVGGRGQLPVG